MIERITALIIYIMLALSASAQSYIYECEDTCRHIHGIDMSHYQGDVFWEALGQNGKIAYVYLKATEGGDRIDHRYEHNIRMAQDNNIRVGSYHFYRAKTPQEVQLKNFRTQCRPKDQDLIPMIDVEAKPSGMSTEDFCDSLMIFIRLVERAYKQKPLIYTYTNFYNKYLQGLLDDYPLMIAQYSAVEPKLNDGKEYIMWQYTAKGHINGVNTYVDKSRFMGRHTLREIRFRHR